MHCRFNICLKDILTFTWVHYIFLTHLCLIDLCWGFDREFVLYLLCWVYRPVFLLKLFCPPEGCCSCKFFQIVNSVVFASQHCSVRSCWSYINLFSLVDQIEASYNLFIAFQSEYKNMYIPSILMIVIVSSTRPTLSSESSFVLAVIEGPPLTSRSQAFPVTSKMKSKP